MSWLEQHIDEFVAPVLREHDRKRGFTSQATIEIVKGLTPLGYFQQEELTVMKNAWRSIKRQADGKTIFLPGRDVWLFEVLARREDYPTVFFPECSRMTVRHIAEQLPDLSEFFLFDTGFAGTIPRAIGSKEHNLLSANQINNEAQVFPRLSFSRGFALRIEDTPKYWESGRMVGNSQTYGNNQTFVINHTANGGVTYDSVQTTTTYNSGFGEKILQPLSHIEEFVKAAQLTVEVYKNSAPKFIPRHKPLPKTGRRY